MSSIEGYRKKIQGHVFKNAASNRIDRAKWVSQSISHKKEALVTTMNIPNCKGYVYMFTEEGGFGVIHVIRWLIDALRWHNT